MNQGIYVPSNSLSLSDRCMELSATPQLLNPREVYETYEEMSTKYPVALERPDQNLVTAAFSLSGAVYVAETLAQPQTAFLMRMTSTSGLDCSEQHRSLTSGLQNA